MKTVESLPKIIDYKDYYCDEEIEKMIEIHLWKIKIITFSPDSYITCGRL